ncbi:ABC transporter substrate-binding protein [Brevibacillus ruminantium]|uniref:ABC transporter substrate-binding protein n=1 Tax=Brevibacillus ruminantium TaxID=2950604 RepID=A0ABY4W832_9BACL|nr:ABC transporter substrate-binding protein [Brevibacillus ruminantium]USG63327.1 ABC transporter substrate-binding protein [Brevibacillus ruminantium]
MIKRQIGFLAIAGVLLSSAIVGCSQSATQKPAHTQQGQQSKEELILAIGGEPDNGFDPTTGWGRYGSPLFQSTLLKRDADFQVVNDLATGYEVSEDRLVWTVKLRDDVKFSDGQPLTADDVVYTFDTAAASGSVVDLHIVDKVEAVDSTTVRFSLKKPQSTFINSLITTGIVPKHAHNKDYAEKPIGSGPYQLVQWDKGQQLIVKANPEYYGKKSAFQKITFLFLNEDAAFAAAKAGKVDMAAIPSSMSKQNVPGMRLEAATSVDNRGIVFPVVKAGEKTKEGYPIGNDVTADPAIRQAVNMAVDRQALVQGILEGHGTPAYTSSDKLPWWNPDTVIKDADLEGAKNLLSSAGWKDADGDGILEKGSLKAEFSLLYPASDVTRQSLSIAVADMMKPLGLSIKAEGKSWDELESLMHANPVMFGWGSHDPQEMYHLYSSTTAGVGYYNPGYYSNPTVDAYMEKALAAATEQEAMEFWKKAQWDGEKGFSAKGDAAWAWLVNVDHVYLVNEHLDTGKQRIHPHGHGWPVTDNIDEWIWNE